MGNTDAIIEELREELRRIDREFHDELCKIVKRLDSISSQENGEGSVLSGMTPEVFDARYDILTFPP